MIDWYRGGRCFVGPQAEQRTRHVVVKQHDMYKAFDETQKELEKLKDTLDKREVRRRDLVPLPARRASCSCSLHFTSSLFYPVPCSLINGRAFSGARCRESTNPAPGAVSHSETS